jgi:hypothetical protein
MRILAVLLVLGLVAIPFVACGGGGGPGCVGECGFCTFSTDCCGFGSGAVCSNQTFDGFARCNFADFTCKMSPP